MGGTDPVVAALADYAPRYREDVFDSIADELDVTRDGLFEADSRKSLEFFYRLYGFNRSEAMKAGYQHRAVEALRKAEADGVIDPYVLWREFERGCERHGVGPSESNNRKLLLETSRFANRKGNLFSWIARELENGVRLERLSDELQSCHRIGPRKARFFLRDVVWLCGAESDVSGRDRHELQPMTGPIQETASVLWPHLDDEDEMADRIVEACESAGVSGIEFNQGAWYFQSRESGDLDALRASLP